MNDLELFKPQRQSILGVAVIFFINLRKAFNFFIFFIVVNLGTKFRVLSLGLEEWAYILSLFFLVISYFQYLKFTFYIKGNNFVIEKGVLSQEKINVPFARIQTVNTSQNLIQRILGVVGLKIDTAGSVQNEIQIPALSKKHAQQLREYLMERKYELAEDTDTEGQVEKANGNFKIDSEPILKLKIKDLFLVGLTQNHFRSGLLLFAIVNGYLWQFEEYLLKPFESYLEQTAESFLSQWLLLLPFAVLLFLIISVLASLVGTVVTHFQFKFFLGEEGMQMKGGLIIMNTFNVPFEKIQYFKWESNPLRALIGFYTLRIKQAGTEAMNDRKLISIPGIKARSLVSVLNRQYPNRKEYPFQLFQVDKLLFIQLAIWVGVFPALLSTAANFWFFEISWLYPGILVYLAASMFFSYRYFQSYAVKVNPDFTLIKRGFVFPSTLLIPNYKLQNICLKQSIFQKSREVASLQLYSAAGGESIVHLPYNEAYELYNYLLFCIESSKRKWM